MATVTITIETDNTAYDTDCEQEIRQVVALALARIGDASTTLDGQLRDTDGKTVGRYQVTP